MNLSFTFSFDSHKVHFLDIVLEGQVDKGVTISPFRKSMARNATLLATSCHPDHVINNIPLGELVRTRRNCTSAETYTTYQEEACNRLRARSYPEWTLTKAKARVAHLNRQNLLVEHTHNTRQTTQTNSLTFSTTYSRQFNNIVNIVKKHLPILSVENSLREVLDEGIRFVSRRAPTIANKVSPSMYRSVSSDRPTWLSTVGFFKCGHRNCTACGFAKITRSFKSCSNGNEYAIRSYINCNTKNVVYLVTCTACAVQYVGCTSTPLKVRIRRHLSDASKYDAIGASMVSKHCQRYHEGNASHLNFCGIERVSKPLRGGDTRHKLFNRESYWIYCLNTRTPNGMNIRQDLMYFY